ncbi:hypothetical protein ACLEPN_30535 [Myxococcus sp. 1LA]
MHRDPLTYARHTVARLNLELRDLKRYGVRGIESASRLAKTRDALARAELELRGLRLAELSKRMTRMRNPPAAPRPKPVQLELGLFDQVPEADDELPAADPGDVELLDQVHEVDDELPVADPDDVEELSNVYELPVTRRQAAPLVLMAGGVH